MPACKTRLFAAATLALFCAASALTAQAQETQPPAPELPATINLSNAGTGQVIAFNTRRGTPDQIQAAIAAGDPRAVYALGGSPRDFMRAAGGDGPDTVRYVIANGHLALELEGTVSFSGLFAGLTPPPGAPTVSLPDGADVTRVEAFVRTGSEDQILFVAPNGQIGMQNRN